MTQRSEQQNNAHHLAHIRNAAAETLSDPHGLAHFINEIAGGLSEDEIRSFALITAASANSKGLQFIQIMGECGKMIGRDHRRPRLDSF